MNAAPNRKISRWCDLCSIRASISKPRDIGSPRNQLHCLQAVFKGFNKERLGLDKDMCEELCEIATTIIDVTWFNCRLMYELCRRRQCPMLRLRRRITRLSMRMKARPVPQLRRRLPCRRAQLRNESYPGFGGQGQWSEDLYGAYAGGRLRLRCEKMILGTLRSRLGYAVLNDRGNEGEPDMIVENLGTTKDI